MLSLPGSGTAQANEAFGKVTGMNFVKKINI